MAKPAPVSVSSTRRTSTLISDFFRILEDDKDDMDRMDGIDRKDG